MLLDVSFLRNFSALIFFFNLKRLLDVFVGFGQSPINIVVHPHTIELHSSQMSLI